MNNEDNIEKFINYIKYIQRNFCSESISKKFLDSPFSKKLKEYSVKDKERCCIKFVEYLFLFIRRECPSYYKHLRINSFYLDEKKIKNMLLLLKKHIGDKSETFTEAVDLFNGYISSDNIISKKAILDCVRSFYPKDKKPSRCADFIVLNEMNKRMNYILTSSELKDVLYTLNSECFFSEQDLLCDKSSCSYNIPNEKYSFLIVKNGIFNFLYKRKKQTDTKMGVCPFSDKTFAHFYAELKKNHIELSGEQSDTPFLKVHLSSIKDNQR